ncbi:MAG: SET domain-containing protein [Saprospiraceae bacterium]|jgi:SET domain-containing protein|nr:SET domain-containing protein [Saprospiraceae bacterium]
MPKSVLINELLHHTYVRLRPSSIHGIGVFAIRNIPKGCQNLFSKNPGDWVELSKTEVEALPSASRDLVETYCLFDREKYYIPANGFKEMDLSLFLNHADNPNVRSVNDGAFFEAIRDIEEGEEITIDYGELCEYDE